MQASSRIEVTTGFMWIAFLLFFVKPVVEVDGTEYKTPWGASSFNVVPGPHTVRIWFPYLIPRRAGMATVQVNVPPQGLSRISYRAPFFVFSPGKVSVS